MEAIPVRLNGKKTCGKCGIEKRLSFFPLARGRGDGFAGLCKDCQNVYSRALRFDYRDRAITILGGRCADCGITDRRLLQIDHIFGDGHLGRKDKWRSGNTGSILTRLICLGKTDISRLQLLCANCHHLKSYWPEGKVWDSTIYRDALSARSNLKEISDTGHLNTTAPIPE